MKNERFDLVIVGGGSAGIDVAARMRRHLPAGSIALLEPSERHFYQPLWTLVGGGEARKEQSMKPEADVMPKGIEWVKEAAERLIPQENVVVTQSGRRLEYKALVVAPGLKIDWEAIPGLIDALKNDPRVSSNYDYELAEKTFEAVRAFRGGKAIFTMPSTPVKCGGAPQKIMYLAEDYWRRHGIREKAAVEGWFAGAKIFAVPEYAKTLEGVVARKKIDMHFRRDLVEIRAATSEAIFQNMDDPSMRETVRYDFMHVTPRMVPPDIVAKSPLAILEGPNRGWMSVDTKTLQSTECANVFGLGDAAGLPTSKTGAAVRKQAVVIERNLVSFLKGEPLTAEYDGYTSCPVVTGYGKLVLAEFGYDNKVMPSFPIDSTKERWSMYMLKKHVLPRMYWDLMLKGLA